MIDGGEMNIIYSMLLDFCKGVVDEVFRCDFLVQVC